MHVACENPSRQLSLKSLFDGCRDLKMQLAVLLYFAHRFEEAQALLKDLPEYYGVRAFLDKMSLVSKR